MVIGRLGQLCAQAQSQAATQANTAATASPVQLRHARRQRIP
jgi:hypothetical protein